MATADTDPGTRDGRIPLADGRSLSWRSTGPADAPVLLWLHGNTGSARTAPVADRVAHPVRVLSYDRPGFGTSTAHPDRDLLSDAADVQALLEHLDIARVRLLAFSGGAAVAFGVAARLGPPVVQHVGIVSGATWPTTPPPPLAALQGAAEALRADPAAAVERLGVEAPRLDQQVLADPALRAELLDGVNDAITAGTEGWVRDALLVRSPWPVTPEQVEVPVSWWHGEQDVAVPLLAAQAAVSALPHAVLHRLTGSGHIGWMHGRGDIVQALVSA
ncbi:alpha/beta fold hydrolase [Kineococcus arenarius]|uniref:alpha/beta fold hydrolase n=1 Tax=unclassified Kineococcus TaxID=2621656 RepID=UPI003D7CEDBB